MPEDIVGNILQACHEKLFPKEAKRSSAGDLQLFPPDITMLITAQICIPIFTKVISDILVDKYKSARSESQVKAAIEEIKRKIDGARLAPLDDPALADEVKGRLMGNGFSDDEAAKVASDLLTLVRDRLTQTAIKH